MSGEGKKRESPKRRLQFSPARASRGIEMARSDRQLSQQKSGGCTEPAKWMSPCTISVDYGEGGEDEFEEALGGRMAG